MIRQARFWHIPQLLCVLWAHTRQGARGHSARTWWTDVQLMVRCHRRGWIRLIGDRRGTMGFLIRDMERLHAIYVHPLALGQGLGRLLIADAKAASPRLELWVLQSNDQAVGFYATQGFAEMHRTDGHGNDEKLPDLCMVWQMNMGMNG
ncbi:N-acetyltransferase [Roseovarius sp. EL26]|uniref:GNAT family N-acetyltransferase n=1 Tax=Roseovarius sp. EL26 TaxID=2126672 RepID=UPI000EA1140C|nr:GNAT family N-acetyltransferase [Roseovarius sp. EL26]